MSDCIFCDIIAGKAPASFVYRDDRVSAFMDIRPVNPGHVLVIPNTHAAYLAELDPEDGAQMFRVGQQLAAAARTAGVRCEGVNLLLADGAPAGQEIFHVHLHVIPRWRGDGSGFRFGTRTENFPSREELDALAKTIKERI
jgi:diadenosine tetraphosphate (Ap4A) HIT family hydrolase